MSEVIGKQKDVYFGLMEIADKVAAGSYGTGDDIKLEDIETDFEDFLMDLGDDEE